MPREFETTLSAYSPQKAGDKMEGGYASSKAGPDGQFLVRTLTGYANKVYGWVTLAGHPDHYNKMFIIPKISFVNKEGKTVNLKNVHCVVHDTGSAFKSADAKNMKRFDIPVAKDMSTASLNKQPFSMKSTAMIEVEQFDEEPEIQDTSADTTTDNSGSALPWMDTAAGLIGLEEYAGSSNNKKIVAWADDVGVEDTYTADSIPWCGLFVAYCFVHNNMKASSAPLWALSWNNWGEKLSSPVYGCVLVFKRDGGGHVGFAVSQDADYFHVLGGNQSDMVSVTKIAKSRCVGYRWPSGFDGPKKKLPTKKFDGKVSTNEA